MVTVSLMIIISVLMLPEIFLNYFYFKEKKEASEKFHIWIWTVGSLAAAYLLSALNSYLIQYWA